MQYISTYTKFSEILTFLTLLIRTRIYQEERNVSFSENFLYLLNSTELKLLPKSCPNTDQKKVRIWTLFTQWAFSNSFGQQSGILDNFQVSFSKKTFFSWAGSYIRLQIFHKVMQKGFWFQKIQDFWSMFDHLPYKDINNSLTALLLSFHFTISKILSVIMYDLLYWRC